MTREERQAQLKQDIEEFEDWCRRVRGQAPINFENEMCVCGHKWEQHCAGNDDSPESPCMAPTIVIDSLAVICPCECDDFEPEKPFEDREAWEHRYGQ